MEKKDDGLYWFVAIVTPNTEKKSVERLDDLVRFWKEKQAVDNSESVTAYVPIQKEVRYRPSTRKRVEVEKVLSPCYLFIQCKNAIRYKIASEARFILHFLMNRASKLASGCSDFARIPDIQMENFMRMVGDAENEVTIDTSRLRVGSKVRIKTGNLAGLEGNIYRDPNGSTMIALRVDFLGYAKMECPLDNLELLDDCSPKGGVN
ncbi:MAG: transcription termination/antitermination NusG family protein [Prevotella sp.]